MKKVVAALADYLNVQANSGVQKSDQILSLRVVVLSNKAQQPQKLEGVELWYPLSDFYMENKEYAYEGLLTKFFGMDPSCNTMMLYNQQGILKWRGGVEDDNIGTFKTLVEEVLESYDDFEI